MKICGVDPGFKGAIVFLNGKGEVLSRYRMPTFTYKQVNGKNKTLIHAETLATIIKSEAPSEVWIEDVHSMPQDGHVGAFSFGRGFGTLIGCFAALDVPTRFVRPQAWKAAMKVTADKSTSRRRALALFPGKEKMLTTADDCEAAMIALYGLMARSVTTLGAKRF